MGHERHERDLLTDEGWARLQPLRPAQELRTGWTAELRTGAPWRDLPERLGRWHTVASRSYRWVVSGVWDRVLAALQCVACHSVAGASNEMFTDFAEHAIASPQLVPRTTNNQFDGAATNEDFGRAEISGLPADRSRFRTPSLRNVAVEAAFMHDGAFTSLEAAIRHHLDPAMSLLAYDPARQGLPPDLAGPIGPTAPLLRALDPRLATPTRLSPTEFEDLLAFVRDGLLDKRATPRELRNLVPEAVPSGNLTLTFEFDARRTAVVIGGDQ